MWSSVLENATDNLAGTVVGMRESNPAWRSHDQPPSPAMMLRAAQITDWLDRGGNINETRMDKDHGHSFLIQACIANNEELVAELLKRGAAVDLKAQGKAALHFATILGHSNCALLLLQNGATPTLRVDQDDTDYTECDGMTSLEIVQSKIVYARDPLRQRLAELDEMLRKYGGA